MLENIADAIREYLEVAEELPWKPSFTTSSVGSCSGQRLRPCGESRPTDSPRSGHHGK